MTTYTYSGDVRDYHVGQQVQAEFSTQDGPQYFDCYVAHISPHTVTLLHNGRRCIAKPVSLRVVRE